MLSRLEKLARLGIEPDALVILEKYGKTLPRDIKLLDEKALAEMKLDAAKLGHLNARRLEVLGAIEAAKGKAAPKAEPAPVEEPEVEETPLPAPAKPVRRKAAK